jgi:hypothetical protein
MVTKKLNSVVFAWDPNAFSGKGYWYVLGSKGGLGRAASKTERLSLGKPSDKDVLPESPKVYEPEDNSKGKAKNKKEKRKEHEYGKAEAIRKTSIGDLIAKNLVEGKGIGESIKGGVTDKIKAIGTGIKEKFDPMNMAKSIGGNFGAALYGKVRGRPQKDLEYFTGIEKEESKKNKNGEKKSYDVVTKKGKNKNPLNTTIGAGSRPLPLRKNDSVSDVAAKLFSLLRKSYEDKKLQMELEKNFEGERKEESARRHKEFIEALLGITGGTVSAQSKAESKGFDIADMINKAIENALGNIDKSSWLTRILSLPGFLAAASIASSLYLTSIVEKKIETAAKEGDIGTTTTEIMKRPAAQSALGAEFQEPMKFSDARDETRKELKAAADKGSQKAKDALKQMDVEDRISTYAAEYLKGKGYEVDEGGVYLASKKGTGFLGFGKERISKKLADEALEYGKNKATPAATQTTESSKETPTAAPAAAPESKPLPAGVNLQDNESRPSKPLPMPMSNALGDRMSSAMNENNSMQDEVAAAPQPISLNNSKVINTNGTDQTFTFDSAAVRNQDMTLNRIQKTFVRYV